jgi:hypothetical protein
LPTGAAAISVVAAAAVVFVVFGAVFGAVAVEVGWDVARSGVLAGVSDEVGADAELAVAALDGAEFPLDEPWPSAAVVGWLAVLVLVAWLVDDVPLPLDAAPVTGAVSV